MKDARPSFNWYVRKMTQYIDTATLEVLQEVMEDEFAEVLQAFIVQAEHDWPAAKEALVADDLDSLSRSAHSLKGSALSLGAGPLSELLESLEHEARSGNQAVCSGLHARADDCMARTLDALRRWAP